MSKSNGLSLHEQRHPSLFAKVGIVVGVILPMLFGLVMVPTSAVLAQEETATFTPTPTSPGADLPTDTASPTPTPLPSDTPTSTSTSEATSTETSIASSPTPTSTESPTIASSPTSTATLDLSASPTIDLSASPTLDLSLTATPTESPTPTASPTLTEEGALMPLAADGENFYYYADGHRVRLAVSLDWISVRFASRSVSLQEERLQPVDGVIGSRKAGIELPKPDVLLLPVEKGVGTSDLIGAVNALRAGDADLLQANPVFQTEDALMAISDEFIATFPGSMGIDQIEAINTANNVEIVDQLLGQEDTYVLRVLPEAQLDALAMANFYQESGYAVSAAPNFVRLLADESQGTGSHDAVGPFSGTNDYYYDDQWALNNVQQYGTGMVYDADIDAPEAWNLSTGSSSVIIAILDEGVQLNHPDLVGKMVGGYDATGLGSGGGYSGSDNHGTMVAGIAAASSNNSIGVAGVCQGCRLMPIRIAYSNSSGYWVTTDSWIANSITWAYQHGAAVLNNSWGGGSPATVINNAISNAKSLGRGGLGSVVVVAAGNDNRSTVSYPASLNTVIAVAATNMCDQRKTPSSNFCNGYEDLWGSNYGSALDISAPGVWIDSTNIGSSYTQYMNGTSAATPIISGVAGLLLSVNPNLSAADVQSILQQTADDVNGGGWDTTLGYGRVNAYNALASISPPANDDKADAFDITSFPYSITESTFTASLESGEPSYTCGSSNNSSAWFKFTPGISEVYQVDTSGSNYDTVLHVFDSSNNLVVCNDTAAGSPQAKASFSATAGVTYWISVTHNNGGGGGSLSFEVAAISPSNDLRNAATTISTSPFVGSQFTGGATSSSDDPKLGLCSLGKGAATVWYEYSPPQSGAILVETAGSDYDTVLALWKKNSNGTLTAIACNDDRNYPDDLTSVVAKNVSAGSVYLIEVMEFAGEPSGANPQKAYQALDAFPSFGGDLELYFEYSPTLSKPVLISPSSNSYTNVVTPSLTWNPVSNAEWYGIEIDNNSNFSSPEVSGETSGGTTFTVPALEALNEGLYYWRVLGGNNVTTSAWSTPFYFRVDTTPPGAPVLSSPADNAAGVRGTPLHSWNAVSGANAYRLQYDEDGGDFTTPVYDSGTITTTKHQPVGFSQIGNFDWRVQARDAAGNWGAWSEVRSLNILPALPKAPVMNLPAKNALTNNNQPTFEWGAVDWATSYELQIDDTSKFTSPEIDESGLAGLSYTPGSALADGGYYWRVRGVNVNSEGGAWSKGLLFTVDTTPPGAPSLKAPADAGTQSTVTPQFTWGAVSTAKLYELVWDDDDDFSSLIGTAQAGKTLYKLGSGEALVLGQTIYWRVRASDAAGNWGPWSAANSFDVSLMTSPTSGSFTTDTTPLFRWAKGSGVVSYSLQIDDDNLFGSPELSQNGITTTQYQVLSPLPYAHYYWRLSADGGATWMPPILFTVTDSAPPQTTLTQPATKSLIPDPRPNFTWAAVAGADTYEIQISAKSNFSSLALSEAGIATASFTPASDLADGLYYWRVRALNSLGYGGSWSKAFTFTVDTTPPGLPVLLNPADNAAGVRGAPLHTWKAASGGANAYQLQYDADSGDFSVPVYDSGVISGLKYQPTGFSQIGDFDWRMRARDAAGNWGAWTPVRSINILPALPARPVLTLPTKNGLTNTDQPYFEWTGVDWAVSYELQIDDNSKFTSPEVDQNGISGTSYTLGTSLADGTYYWRVLGVNVHGELGSWSASFPFKVDTTPPGAPLLGLPAHNSNQSTTVVQFTWKAVSTASLYQLVWDDNDDFSSPLGIAEIAKPLYKLTADQALQFGDVVFWRVRARDAAGNWGPWSESYKFNVSLMKSPSEGSFYTDTTPLFTWLLSKGVSSYALQVDDDPNFASPEAAAEVSADRYQIIDTLAYGVYYWRLSSNSGTTWMPANSFVVTPPALPGPSGQTPPSGQLLNTSTPSLAWDDVTDADHYEVEIANATKFASNTILLQDLNLSTAAYTAASDLPDGKYYWRVRAVNSLGYPGLWSTTLAFTVDTTPPGLPKLLLPADNVTGVRGAPLHTWKAASGANAYQLQYDEDGGDFTSPVFDSGVITGLKYQPVGFSEIGAFDWRMRARDGAGNWGEWTPVRSISILPAIPGKPTLTTPANSASVFASQPDFEWTPVDWAVTYELQIDDNSAFTSPEVDQQGIGTTSFTPSAPLADGAYYWQVRAVNVNAESGSWSKVYLFTVDTTP